MANIKTARFWVALVSGIVSAAMSKLTSAVEVLGRR